LKKSSFFPCVQKSIQNLIATHPLLSTCLLGAIGALAFAPFHFYILLIPSFCGLLFLLKSVKSLKQAFVLGLSFGFGHFSAGTFWVAVSFTKVGLTYLMPLGVAGFALLLSIFPAITCALTTYYQRNSLQQALLFSVFWSLTEWTRGHILTGFPWNLVGYAWDLPMLQICAWIGIYGLSFLTILAATIWMTGSRLLMINTLVISGLLWTAGSYRAEKGDALGNTGVNMRIIQPSVQQELKWSSEHVEKNINLHIALSQLEAERPLKAIIWPEAAVPLFLETLSELRDHLKNAIPPEAYLLTGAPRKEQKTDSRENDITIWSSLFALNSRGQVTAKYDKAHLVPFGEYVPFRSILPIQKITPGAVDYSPGKKLETLKVEGIPPFSPLICYEAIFPGKVVDPKSDPKWLLNITNDAWYGHTNGPYQHLDIVRVRAIEEGIPLVRAANNGISAVIDAYGKILYRLELDEIGFIDFDLPKALIQKTFYNTWREFPFVFMLMVVLLISYSMRNEKSGVDVEGDQT
jgi:apolipoprotein N-acyltransferase